MENINMKELINNRRALHSIPELCLCESETSLFIKQKLREYDINFEDEIGDTHGIIGVIRVNDGPAIAYRTDMDALPLQEESGVEFASKHEGIMHACGHDGHMAMALELARFCSLNRKKIKKNIIFLFQPAEESQCGAMKMINSGFIEKYHVECIIGAHVFPDLDEGCIGCTPGPIMSGIGIFRVKIQGISTHSAIPQNGADALVAACHFVIMLQSILTRMTNPMHGTSVNIGKIQSGNTDNLVASKSELLGNIRSLDSQNYAILKKTLIDAAQNISELLGCSASVEFLDEYPEVNNNQHLYEFVKKSAVGNFIEVKPQLISEDFSFYQKRIPGVFVFVGIRNKDQGNIYPLHNSKFRFNESALCYGVATFENMFINMGVL